MELSTHKFSEFWRWGMMDILSLLSHREFMVDIGLLPCPPNVESIS